METVPSYIADARGRTVLMGLRVLWSSSFIWSCKVFINYFHFPYHKISPQEGLVDLVPVLERNYGVEFLNANATNLTHRVRTE